MTGDGVNDGPALKAAHIGIAMGRGTAIAKDAASLVLVDDDLSKMVSAIAMGRKIYGNLKKAIRYIISIHIPIILVVFVPLAAGWVYPNLFSPIHVIFLELIMGPTCSIIYENEPMEPGTMLQKPRPMSRTFFNWRELSLSIVQGLVVAGGVLAAYQLSVWQDYEENLVRTMVFSTLVIANIFMTLANRSFEYSAIATLRYKNDLLLGILAITAILMGTMLYFGPAARLFGFESPGIGQLAICWVLGFTSIMWLEAYKWIRRIRN